MKHRIPRAGASVLILAMAVALGGCKGSGSGPDCKAVAASYASLLRAEIEKPASAAGASGEATVQRDEALSLIPVLKEALVKECEDKKWDAEARRCVVAAATPDDIERCRTHGDEEEAPAAGSGGETAPPKAPETAPQPEKSGTP